LRGMVSSPLHPLIRMPPTATANAFKHRHQIDLATQTPPQGSRDGMSRAGCARRQPAVLGRRTALDPSEACEYLANCPRTAPDPRRCRGASIAALQLSKNVIDRVDLDNGLVFLERANPRACVGCTLHATFGIDDVVRANPRACVGCTKGAGSSRSRLPCRSGCAEQQEKKFGRGPSCDRLARHRFVPAWTLNRPLDGLDQRVRSGSNSRLEPGHAMRLSSVVDPLPAPPSSWGPSMPLGYKNLALPTAEP
jgi:hypothetical protein